MVIRYFDILAVWGGSPRVEVGSDIGRSLGLNFLMLAVLTLRPLLHIATSGHNAWPRGMHCQEESLDTKYELNAYQKHVIINYLTILYFSFFPCF